jgi:hypothetical protein
VEYDSLETSGDSGQKLDDPLMEAVRSSPLNADNPEALPLRLKINLSTLKQPLGNANGGIDRLATGKKKKTLDKAQGETSSMLRQSRESPGNPPSRRSSERTETKIKLEPSRVHATDDEKCPQYSLGKQ